MQIENWQWQPHHSTKVVLISAGIVTCITLAPQHVRCQEQHYEQQQERKSFKTLFYNGKKLNSIQSIIGATLRRAACSSLVFTALAPSSIRPAFGAGRGAQSYTIRQGWGVAHFTGGNREPRETHSAVNVAPLPQTRTKPDFAANNRPEHGRNCPLRALQTGHPEGP